jgi:alpha-beta hydrolase superfamily lysophospholipase
MTEGPAPRRFTLEAWDGVAVAAYGWPIANERAVVLIAHGMGEHALRYGRLAAALNRAGYGVLALDHRGHGATARSGELGDFGPRGFEAVVEDLGLLVAHARRSSPAPVILLGHSMGSLAAQLFVLDRGAEIDGLVLSGSTAFDVIAQAMGDPAAVKLDSAFNAAFEPARTPFDWLSRDEGEVDRYIADPLCGFTVTPEGMASMFAAAARTADPHALANIPKTLPCYVMAGDTDPLNGGLALLNLLVERYRNAGLGSVATAFYAGGRHEMFNETNRDQVAGDLIAWLDAAL